MWAWATAATNRTAADNAHFLNRELLGSADVSRPFWNALKETKVADD